MNILLVEDEASHIELIWRVFERRAPDIRLLVAHDLDQARSLIATQSIDLMITDWLLPDGLGTDVLPWHDRETPFPVIVMTSHGNEQVAVEAMKSGALDYVVKSAETLADMPHIAERALREWRHIAERRQAEQEIVRLQHLLQNITDSMPSALITLDTQGHVLTWNPAAARLTYYHGEILHEHTLWEQCPMLAGYRALMDEVLRTERVAQRPRELLHTPAGPRYYDIRMFPLRAEAIVGVVLYIDDATQRVHMEETMLQATKMASVGGLAAGMAHEINNPLGAMMQSAQLLQMMLDVEHPITRQRLEAVGVVPEQLAAYLQERHLFEYAQGIRDMGERAAKIVSDLLSFSRKGGSPCAPRDLNALIEQALELAAADYDLSRQYDFRDVNIVYEFAPTLPEIPCDGQQIQQVILNLVRNAAQAMADKRAAQPAYAPRLILRTLSMGDGVRVEVEDNGPGMSEAVRQRLFEPFFTTKDVGEGTGLGLWLCWSIIVERHDGRIWVEPAQAEGTRFVFELPSVP